MASDTQKRHIVIIGGGIIGCTSAYFLTRHPAFNPALHKITILEAQSIASGASGKAGGLLALWAYPACIVPLSYKLHAELAQEHDGVNRWGYRGVYCGSLSARGKDIGHAGAPSRASEGTGTGNNQEWQKLPKTGPAEPRTENIQKGIPSDLDWFDGDTLTAYSEMGTPETTAQVHPYQFTTSMADLALEAGAEVILGSVTSIAQTKADGVESVTYTNKTTQEMHTIPATDVVLSAGPWTSHVYPAAPIEATRAHSVVIEADVSPYAIFSDITLPAGFGGKNKKRHGNTVSPEMYARPDGTVYACGEGDTTVPLPATSALVETSPSSCADILGYVSSISPALRQGAVRAQQACYLPGVSTGGGPLIGRTPVRGLLLAAGHTCWGIQNSCATGKLISEFVFDGEARSADITSLDPRRVM